MEAELRTYLADLKSLRLEVKGETHERISKKSISRMLKKILGEGF
jgi:hypothetical protein